MARDIYPPALSKTAKYKKITKPLLERKRRARINRCLDELKDLMVGALEIDDDNMSKLEKADILELTVNHLTKLHGPRDPALEAKRFQAGFGQCAAEACRFILALPDLDTRVSENLVNHLSRLVGTQPLTVDVPARPTYSPPVSPPSRRSPDTDRSSSDGRSSPTADGYPDDVSQYSASSAWSRPRGIPVSPSAEDLACPMSGLLTTVDRVRSPPRHPIAVERGRRNDYFERVPAECKDVILQKIRQHIMEKRGSESCNEIVRASEEYPPRISAREGPTWPDRGYGSGAVPADTLDLRKIRTPSKVSPEKRRYTDSPPAMHRNVASPQTPVASDKLRNPPIDEAPIGESKVAILPEQLAVDYSNLPPKKKRKLLEYQEYMKREEARRLDEIARQRNEYLLMNAHPENGELDVNNPAWRPW